jgi:saccharopine dehydrogenase-like NADP-dependent oxidoreductase
MNMLKNTFHSVSKKSRTALFFHFSIRNYCNIFSYCRDIGLFRSDQITVNGLISLIAGMVLCALFSLLTRGFSTLQNWARTSFLFSVDPDSTDHPGECNI